MELTEETERELAELTARFGKPLGVDAAIDDSFDDPIRRKDRFGEVCMVIRRPNGKLLLSIKTSGVLSRLKKSRHPHAISLTVLFSFATISQTLGKI